MLNYGDGISALMIAPRALVAAPTASPTDEVDEPTDEVTGCETQAGESVPEFYRRYFRCVRIELNGDTILPP